MSTFTPPSNDLIIHQWHLGEEDGGDSSGPYTGTLIAKDDITVPVGHGKRKKIIEATFMLADGSFAVLRGLAANLGHLLSHLVIGERVTLAYVGRYGGRSEGFGHFVFDLAIEDSPERSQWIKRSQTSAAEWFKDLGKPFEKASGQCPEPSTALPSVDAVQLFLDALKQAKRAEYAHHVKSASDITAKPISDAVDGLIFYDVLNFVFGRPGMGKGLWIAQVIGHYSNGRPFEGYSRPGRSLKFVYVVAGSEDPLEMVKLRHIAAGVDFNNVLYIDSTPFGSPSFSPECTEFYAAVCEDFGADFIVFDSFDSLSAVKDTNASRRHLLDPLALALKEMGVGCIVMAHSKKDSIDVSDLADMLSGSLTNVAAARSVVFLGYHKDDKNLPKADRRIGVIQTKTNYSAGSAAMLGKIGSRAAVDEHGEVLLKKNGEKADVGLFEFIETMVADASEDMFLGRPEPEADESSTTASVLETVIATRFPAGFWYPTKEMQADLKRETGASVPTINRVLLNLGYEYKKNESNWYRGLDANWPLFEAIVNGNVASLAGVEPTIVERQSAIIKDAQRKATVSETKKVVNTLTAQAKKLSEAVQDLGLLTPQQQEAKDDRAREEKAAKAAARKAAKARLTDDAESEEAEAA